MNKSAPGGAERARLWPTYDANGWTVGPKPYVLGVTKVEVDVFHREHALVELDIRDPKDGAGLKSVGPRRGRSAGRVGSFRR